MDPVITAALISTAGFLVVALLNYIGNARNSRGISDIKVHTDGMQKTIEGLAHAAGYEQGVKNTTDQRNAVAAAVVEGRQQAKDEKA